MSEPSKTCVVIWTVVLAACASACGTRVVALEDLDGAAADAATGDGNSDAAARADVAGRDVTAPDVAVPPPLLCEPGQWCWQAPLPQGHAINAVFTVSASEAWAVGDRGAVLRYAGGAWRAVASPTTFNLRRIWGSGSSDVWAIGANPAPSGSPQFVLVHWDGARWSVVPHGVHPYVQNIDGSAADNVWLVTTGSQNAALLRWNGAAFVDAPALPSGMRARSVCVRSASEVWATASETPGGFPIALYRWDGATWALTHRAPLASGERFHSEVTCPADGVAVVGYFSFNDGIETYIEVRDGRVGGGDIPLPRSSGAQLFRTPHGEVFYKSATEAVQWTPTGWRRRYSLGAQPMHSAQFDYALDGSAGWIANATPFVFAWREGGWSRDPSVIPSSMAVFALSNPGTASDPVAVFGAAMWARRAGAQWQFAALPLVGDGMDFTVVDGWAAIATHTWLVGSRSVIARFDAVTQTVTPTVVSLARATTFNDVDGSDANTAWAVGDNAAVARFDGERWVEHSVALPRVVDGINLTSLNLTAVDVASASDVMILGNDVAGGRFASLFFRWDGAAWSAESSFGTTLSRFDRDSRGNQYVIEGSTVKKRAASGGAWSALGSFDGSPLRLRVYGEDEVELVASTEAGAALYRWDIDRRAFVLRGAPAAVDGIANVIPGSPTMAGRETYWAAGPFGAVLRFEPTR